MQGDFTVSKFLDGFLDVLAGKIESIESEPEPAYLGSEPAVIHTLRKQAHAINNFSSKNEFLLTKIRKRLCTSVVHPSFFLIAPFPDHCLLVPFYYIKGGFNGVFIACTCYPDDQCIRFSRLLDR